MVGVHLLPQQHQQQLPQQQQQQLPQQLKGVSTLQQLLGMARREGGDNGQDFITAILAAEAKAKEAKEMEAKMAEAKMVAASVQTLQMKLKSEGEGNMYNILHILRTIKNSISLKKLLAYERIYAKKIAITLLLC